MADESALLLNVLAMETFAHVEIRISTFMET